jgi:hypothetical protein
MYQSVLGNLAWADDLESPFLRTLRQVTENGMLSFKFNLDGCEDGIESWPDDITFGRMVGSIGPYRRDEPLRFVAGRRLRKAYGNGKLNDGPCRVDEPTRTVFVDLGNSIPMTHRGGPLADVGPLSLAVLAGDGTPTVLAPLDGIDADFYEKLAGIATVKLTPAQLTAVTGGRLAVVTGTPPVVLLAENPDSTWVHADGSVFKLYPAPGQDTARTTVHVTKFGQPAAGVDVYLGTGQPQPPFTYPAKVTTDAQGRATVVVTATDPGHPRPNLDGQAAQAPYGVVGAKQPDGQLSVRVFDLHRAPARPTWNRDVWPIFQRYANLFPAMRPICDLGSYQDVTRHAEYIKRTLLAPVDSPNHMPVTRDLSPGKRDMIVKWLETSPVPPVLEIDSIEELRSVLQQAVLLEQATIAPYSAALFSIKPGANLAVANLIKGVLLEEMQHMAQVCNILNAIGGAPQIGRPGAVPTYPGRLPAPVLPDLTIRLRRMSIEQVRDVFMAIEQPEHPTVDGKPFKGAVIPNNSVTVDRNGSVSAADPHAMQTLENWFTSAEYSPQTVGWFYNQIARAIVRLDKAGKLFTGDPARQVGWPGAPGTLYQVTDRRSALLGLYQIIEQGEGSPHDLDGDAIAEPNELGHYYRFEEIVRGRQLVRNKQGDWVFEGPSIPFDPTGVYPVIDDPDTFRLPANSVARQQSTLCDQYYTNVLTSLNQVFNGHPDQMDNSVGLMAQLQAQANKLFTIADPAGSGAVLGPAFQSPGVTL